MMTGHVTAKPEAVIVVELVGANPVMAKAVVDTGFNGELILSRPVLESGVTAQPLGPCVASLVDGRELTTETFVVTVLWHGHPRTVVAMQTEDETLVGMALLEGSRLTMEVWDGGTVVIAETT